MACRGQNSFLRDAQGYELDDRKIRGARTRSAALRHLRFTFPAHETYSLVSFRKRYAVEVESFGGKVTEAGLAEACQRWLTAGKLRFCVTLKSTSQATERFGGSHPLKGPFCFATG